MNLICWLFGHRMPKWQDYHTIAGSAVDGIKRWHGYLKCKCQRCGEEVSSGAVHLPTTPPRELAQLLPPETTTPSLSLNDIVAYIEKQPLEERRRLLAEIGKIVCLHCGSECPEPDRSPKGCYGCAGY